MRTVLACSVRGCGLPLARVERTWVCSRGHSFDIARSGYVNLAQPQDRRSPEAGDAAPAVAARAGLLEQGVGRSIVDAFAAVARRVSGAGVATTIVDLGCGSGELLARLCEDPEAIGVGIDLSVPAVERASRNAPHLTWVVANADRRLPLLDRSVDLAVSFHGRRNPAECARVLASGGHLLVAVPAPDDLIELRAAVLGNPLPRDRGPALIAEHAPMFEVLERGGAREAQHLDRGRLHDVLRGTYRGARAASADAVAGLESLDVTFASEFFVFGRREEPR